MPDPTPGLELEGEQRAALDDVIDWVIHPDENDRVLTLGGWAGSGKTVLVRHIHAYLNSICLDSAITSLTGKAVLVLRQKGIESAQTMHSLLYYVDNRTLNRTGQLKFIKRRSVSQNIIIVDEGQTLSESALQDFLSFPHVRVILVGDPAQLKPVGGESISLIDRPRIKLEEVRRQALGSNIIKLANAVRQGLMPTYGQAPGVLLAPRAQFLKDIEDPTTSQIIVGFNSTRHRVNELIRKMRGRTSPFPQTGDKVICLSNNPGRGLYNGQIFEVMDSHNLSDEVIQMNLRADGEEYPGIKAITQQFGRNKLDYSIANRLYRKGWGTVNFFDFADSISCHKALGSQWDSVAVLEEFHPEWEGRRWIYSSMTRAVNDLRYYR